MTTVDNAMAICTRLETIYTEPMLDMSYTLYMAMVHMRDNVDVNGEPATKANVLGLNHQCNRGRSQVPMRFQALGWNWIGSSPNA